MSDRRRDGPGKGRGGGGGGKPGRKPPHRSKSSREGGPRRGDEPSRGRKPPRGGKPPRRDAGAPRDGGRIRSSLADAVVGDVKATAKKGMATDVVRKLERAVEAMERGRPSEAVRVAEEAKRLAPRSAAVREILGLALYQAESFREALRELQAYRRISGRADQNHVIADCHRALGAPEKAVPLAQEALAARIPEESRAEAAVVGGAALADLGRFEEALTILRRFRTEGGVARPYDLRVWYVTGDVLEQAGRRREAAREFRRILQHDRQAFDAAERVAALE